METGNMCVCVCIHTHTLTHTHTHIYVYIYIYTYIHTHTHTYIQGYSKWLSGILTTCHTQYTWGRSICVFLKFNRTTLQVFVACLTGALYMWTLCDYTNINTIIEFVPHVTGDGFTGGSDSYLHFRVTHTPCLLKLCIPPSNGIVRWCLFPEFGAELPLDNCTRQ